MTNIPIIFRYIYIAQCIGLVAVLDRLSQQHDSCLNTQNVNHTSIHLHHKMY